MSDKGDLVIRTLAMPRDTNANGDIFGGWVLSQMDLGGGIAAKQLAGSAVVTVSINAMSFLKPVYVGDTVCCYAKNVHIGKTSMRFKIEVWVKRTLSSGEHEKVTEGEFTFVAINEQGEPQPVQRT